MFTAGLVLRKTTLNIFRRCEGREDIGEMSTWYFDFFFGWKDCFSNLFVFVEVTTIHPVVFVVVLKQDIFEVQLKMSNLKFQNPKTYVEVSLYGDTSKTPQNDHFK